MCRVRFGLTGIHFDSLEPSRPREEFLQPLIAAVPSVRGKQGEVVPEAIVGGAIREENDRLVRNTRKDTSIGSKRVRDLFSSVSSSSSPASVSSPPSSDDDRVHQSANSKKIFRGQKPVNSRTTQKGNEDSTFFRRPSKAPPTKRVRFAMDVQEEVDDASNTSSSHSSDDSYTDPPSPIGEPYDAFAGYYRTPGASRSHGANGRIAGSRMRFSPDEEINTDAADGFLDSEDGSEVDVQGLSVKGRPPRTVRAAGKGDQRRRQNASTPLARSKRSGRVLDQSRVMASGLKSNIDGELNLEQSHVSQERPVSPLRSGSKLRSPKLPSGKNLPEPIFVLRPRFLSDAKEKGKPANVLNSGGCNRDISKNPHEGMKALPSRPAQVKYPKKKKTPKYQPPSVGDDLRSDAEFDADLGLLIRDV